MSIPRSKPLSLHRRVGLARRNSFRLPAVLAAVVAAILYLDATSTARAADPTVTDATATSASATASAAAANSEGLQEIVVTATKVAETVHNVPMSITAITQGTLEAAQIVDFTDYARFVPNLTYASTYGVQSQDVALRGIQGTDTTAFYIDDIPVTQSINPRLLDDVQRIEVLRGPQGTLYGARSMGGAIRTITISPDVNNYHGGINVQGTQSDPGHPGYQADGYFNIPLIAGTLALRVSGFYGSTGPFINRQWLEPPNPAVCCLTYQSLTGLPASDFVNQLTARNNYDGVMAQLLWQATDNLSVRVVYMNQTSDYDGWPLSDFYLPDDNLNGTGLAFSADSLQQRHTFNIPEFDNQHWYLGGVTVTWNTGIGTLTSATSYFHEWQYNRQDTTEWAQNLVLQYPFPPFNGVPIADTIPSPIDSWNNTHQFVEELRFSSQLSGPVQFTAGVYIFRQDMDGGQFEQTPGLNALSGGAFCAAYGTCFPANPDLLYYSEGLGQDFEQAVYGEATYHITSRFSVTAGARESHIYSYFNGPEVGYFGAPVTPGSDSENDFSPKFSVQFRQNDYLNYYALADKGWRPGAPQVAPSPTACAADYKATGLTPADLSKYGADWLWNYEVGVKTQTPKLMVNVALFDIQWTSIQQQARFPFCGYVYTVNGGAARSKGGEIELAAAPVRGLQLNAGVGYTDAVITQTTANLRELQGSPVQNVAPWTGSFGAGYTFPVTSVWSGVLHANYSYTDKSYSASISANPERLRPAYSLVNFNAGMESEHIEYGVFIDNLTNAHPNLGDNPPESGEDPGVVRILTMPPRTYGVRAGYKF